MSKKAISLVFLCTFLFGDLPYLAGAPISFRFEGSSVLNVALEALGFASPASTARSPQTLRGFRISPIILPGEKREGTIRTLRNARGEKVVVAVDKGIQPQQVIHAKMFKEEQKGDEKIDVKLSLHLNDEGERRLGAISAPGKRVAIMVGEQLFLEMECKEEIKRSHLMVTGNVNRRTLFALERALGIKAQAKPKEIHDKIVLYARKAQRLERLNEKEHLACTYLQMAWKAVHRARTICEDESIKNIPPSRLAFEKGMAYSMSLDINQAKEQFEIAAKDPGYRPMSLAYLGDIHRIRGEKEKARECYQEARKAVPAKKEKHLACLIKHIDQRLAEMGE